MGRQPERRRWRGRVKGTDARGGGATRRRERTYRAHLFRHVRPRDRHGVRPRRERSAAGDGAGAARVRMTDRSRVQEYQSGRGDVFNNAEAGAASTARRAGARCAHPTPSTRGRRARGSPGPPVPDPAVVRGRPRATTRRAAHLAPGTRRPAPSWLSLARAEGALPRARRPTRPRPAAPPDPGDPRPAAAARPPAARPRTPTGPPTPRVGPARAVGTAILGRGRRDPPLALGAPFERLGVGGGEQQLFVLDEAWLGASRGRRRSGARARRRGGARRRRRRVTRARNRRRARRGGGRAPLAARRDAEAREGPRVPERILRILRAKERERRVVLVFLRFLRREGGERRRRDCTARRARRRWRRWRRGSTPTTTTSFSGARRSTGRANP